MDEYLYHKIHHTTFVVRLLRSKVSPISPGVLQVVTQDELIDLTYQIEIASPRYVVRLNNRDALIHVANCFPNFSRQYSVSFERRR